MIVAFLLPGAVALLSLFAVFAAGAAAGDENLPPGTSVIAMLTAAILLGLQAFMWTRLGVHLAGVSS